MNLTVVIGLLAQFFFSARILVQWIKSERAHRIESPTLFWLFSVIGSVLLFAYGWMRDDFSIIFGESLSFYIYLWNLKAKGLYDRMAQTSKLLLAIPWVLAILPVLLLLFIGMNAADFRQQFFRNEDVPLYALLWGSLGQFIYKSRFVYQWYYSFRHRQSLLPLTFWWLAVIGSAMIIVYGIYRLDWILCLGQIGIIASIRNIVIGRRQFATKRETARVP
ncbi:MAG: lipid-A-disaccharide synthase N-terminal domain-containing protein [Bacteroidales bacterium]|nr:lipid-A-disaccharide synthase N-terminal domain-containing protein [Bacteroidales bacterium]